MINALFNPRLAHVTRVHFAFTTKATHTLEAACPPRLSSSAKSNRPTGVLPWLNFGNCVLGQTCSREKAAFRRSCFERHWFRHQPQGQKLFFQLLTVSLDAVAEYC